MKFSTRVDVDVPAEATFAAFADFPRFVRLAEKRGAKVVTREARVFAWAAQFDWNGKAREMEGAIAAFDPPQSFAAEMTAGGLEGTLEVEVTPLGAARSRARVAMEWRPRTMAGRILLQSLKLVKGRLDERFATRVADYAAEIGTRT